MTDPYLTVLDDLGKLEMTVYRWNMVQYALKHGVAPAARFYNTSRKTVAKWVKIYRKEGRQGLVDRRKGPHHQAQKTPQALADQIIEFRKRHPHLGARRIRIEMRIALSAKAIHRILSAAGLVQRRRTRYRKRQDLRAIKQGRYAPGGCWQNDVMYFTDLPSVQELMQKDPLTPRYAYTIRDVHSGAVFMGYAQELSEKHAQVFIDLCLTHFRRFGLVPENLIIQTDNGSEFSGARYTLWEREGYSHTVHVVHGAEHRFIPPGCSNANGDIESFHNLIQREFFELSRFEDREDLVDALTAYLFYFNTTRYSLSKGARTPLEILQPFLGNRALQFLALPPVNLDTLVYRNKGATYLTSLAEKWISLMNGCGSTSISQRGAA
jgi:transposase InsO family protein